MTPKMSTTLDSDFLKLAAHRCSVRDFSAACVEREKIEQLLEAARLAPSAVNYQPWLFLVITSAEGKAAIQDCYPRDWFKTAPLYILICADHEQSWKRKSDGKDHADIDTAIAIEHLCLEATQLGLGSCWVCNFDATICRSLFEIPEHLEPIAILPIGYPTDKEIFTQTPKKRKPLNEIVRWEKI